MGGKRDNNGKPRLSLIPKAANDRMAEVLGFGAEKYGEWNWRAAGKKLSLLKIIDSLSRHIDALKDGEDNDPESGLHHIGHMLCNCAFIAQLLEDGTLIDDRYCDEEYVDRDVHGLMDWSSEGPDVVIRTETMEIKDDDTINPKGTDWVDRMTPRRVQ